MYGWEDIKCILKKQGVTNSRWGSLLDLCEDGSDFWAAIQGQEFHDQLIKSDCA